MSESRTDSVLDAIDGALADRTVSGDAMRWTPDPPPAPARQDPRAPARSLDELRRRAATGTLTDQDVENIQAMVRVVEAAFRPVRAAIIEAGRRLGRMFAGIQAETRRDYALVPPRPLIPADVRLIPADMRLRALEARRSRGTGPDPDRLDGRRTP